MNRKIRRMKQEIERRGGMIHVSGTLPDAVAEAFLQQILDCPDCRSLAHSEGITPFDPEEPSIDTILAGDFLPWRKPPH